MNVFNLIKPAMQEISCQPLAYCSSPTQVAWAVEQSVQMCASACMEVDLLAQFTLIGPYSGLAI